MTVLKLAPRGTGLRGALLLVAAALVLPLAACAPETPIVITPPTMAPQQTVAEACAIARDEVDRVTAEVEAQVAEGLDQAGKDLAAGTMPSFDFLRFSLDGTLADIEAQLSNEDVLSAVSGVRGALQSFGELTLPDSLAGAWSFIASIGASLSELASSSSDLKELCGSTSG